MAHWLRSGNPHRHIEIETDGIRSSVIAAIAAAIDPHAIDSIQSRHSIKSLAYLLDTPVSFRSAADLFCFDLYKDFDMDVHGRIGCSDGDPPGLHGRITRNERTSQGIR